MITIKDYAKQKGVSYEAIRKQIKRYEDELEGHLVKQNRFLMLDDEAVQFLDSKRSENPVIVYEQNKDEELEQLRHENKVLLIQMNTVQDQLGKVQQKLIAEMNTTKLLTQEKVQYLEYKAQSEQKEIQLKDLARQRRLVLVPVEGQDLDDLVAAYPLYQPVTIPMGTYPNQTRPCASVALQCLLVTRQRVDQEQVRNFLARIWPHWQELKAGHPVLPVDLKKRFFQDPLLPLAPGAEQFQKDSQSGS
mgnify:CR=1 FL=1